MVMEVAPTLEVTVPLETEVIHAHRVMVTGTRYVKGHGIVIDMDVRRGSWSAWLGLAPKTKVHWSDVRSVEIAELSPLPWKMFYCVTLGDGWYRDRTGAKHCFGVGKHLSGIDLERGVTEVTLRAAVLLTVLGGLGVRAVTWLMLQLFQVTLSKSAVERYVQECASELPDAAGMAQALNQDKPITECNIDEIFARGQRPKPCTVVLRDGHGRVFAVKELLERTTAAVTAFLLEVKGWGICPKQFYMDGCDAYREAVRTVFPDAIIQYDYFHIIQNAWKKLWKTVVKRRRDLKERAKEATSAPYAKQLEKLALAIWDNRYLFLKRDDNMSPEEKDKLLDIITRDSLLLKVRKFAEAVWDVFTPTNTQEQARTLKEKLAQRPEVQPDSAFEKICKFLDERFDDMTAYLRCPGVRRNSLAETGIRFLRRMEQGHDGFRSAEGLDRHLRIYQAAKYLRWPVHRMQPGLGLLSSEPTAASP